jgi:hypothetical protein
MIKVLCVAAILVLVTRIIIIMGNCCGAQRQRRPSLRGEIKMSEIWSLREYELSINPMYDSEYSDVTVPMVQLATQATSTHRIVHGGGSAVKITMDVSDIVSVPRWTSSLPYGYSSFEVTNRATTIEWKGYGLKIQILDDSIPPYITTARLDVSVHYISNPLYLPVPAHREYWPVSALYSIKVGSGKLCKPVTIEIQHCSNPISWTSENITLLRASSEREYFRPVAGAMFNRRTKCGRVIVPKLDFVEDQEYDDFSWFIIAIRWVFFRDTIYYKAQVYISKRTMMMHFIVIMALDLCSTVSCLQLLHLATLLGNFWVESLTSKI